MSSTMLSEKQTIPILTFTSDQSTLETRIKSIASTYQPPFGETREGAYLTSLRKAPLNQPTYHDDSSSDTEKQSDDGHDDKKRRQGILHQIRRRVFPVWMQWGAIGSRIGLIFVVAFLISFACYNIGEVQTAGIQAFGTKGLAQPVAETTTLAPVARRTRTIVPAGLVAVDLAATEHPVTKLIRDAREDWDKKVREQSRTLKLATERYQGKYGRPPPRGFDKWWKYAKENNVQLLDEYDQIHQDIFPFRGLSPASLKKRISRLMKNSHTYTIRVENGKAIGSMEDEYKKIQGAEARLDGQMEFLKPIAQYLDNVIAVYNMHDYPRNLVEYDYIAELMDKIDVESYVADTEHSVSLGHGFAGTCAPVTPLRRISNTRLRMDKKRIQKTTSVPYDGKSFIVNHKESMSVCHHPEHLKLHSAFADRKAAHGGLEPFFSYSKTLSHTDILGVPTDFWTPPLADQSKTEWSYKTNDKLLWRGTTTGQVYDEKIDWKPHHRFRMVSMASNQSAHEILPGKLPKGKTLQDALEIRKGSAVVKDLDVGFINAPKQCADEATCAAIKAQYKWHDKMGFDEALRYKYTLDVDGNGWSARYKRLLDSGTLVFKSTVYPEWWLDRSQAWVHYIPVQVNYSDLYDLLEYFKANDEVAAEIAKAGRDWAANFWRKEDMTAYVFRLYLEWQRLLEPAKDKRDMRYDPSMEL